MQEALKVIGAVLFVIFGTLILTIWFAVTIVEASEIDDNGRDRYADQDPPADPLPEPPDEDPPGYNNGRCD